MQTKVIRPSFEETIFSIAHTWARRSTCPRLNAGAVAVNERFQVLAAGYNGAVRGAKHCLDDGCLIVDKHCQRSVHAETNMICQAAYEGTSLKGCRVYITARPCQVCIKMLVQVGCVEVHYFAPYNTDGVKDQVETIARHAGVKLYGPYSELR